MANPLTLFMPVTPGTAVATIATMLQQNQTAIDQALTTIGTVHYARFLILDASSPNLQPSGAASDSLVIGIITAYDGDFDPYIGDFVKDIGDVFDALLKFVVGGPALIPVKDNLTQFTAFIQANDASQHVPNGGLYQAYPTLTVNAILACESSTS